MDELRWELVKEYLIPIMPYFDMDGVTEIMVNSFDSVYVKISGEMKKVDEIFQDERTVSTIIHQIAVATDQSCNEIDSPEVNARLWDGSRFCGMLFPWSSKGCNFTIRIFPKNKLTTDDLLNYGSISPDMLNYLKLAVGLYKNILISGSTDSGKTTFLNILATYVSPADRFITVEDTQEIQVDLPNWVAHVAVDKRRSKNDLIVKSLADLIRTTLRENPTRICVGEIRDSDSALAFMRALNTGHNGCFSSLHANDPMDAIDRMTDLLGEAGKQVEFARKQVISNLQIIVQAQEIRGVGKRIVQIMEVSRSDKHEVIFDYDYVNNKHIDGSVNFHDSLVYHEAIKFGMI